MFILTISVLERSHSGNDSCNGEKFSFQRLICHTEKWIFIRAKTKDALDFPVSTSDIKWHLGGKVVIKAESEDEAKRILFNYVSSGGSLLPQDPFLCIEQESLPPRQERITDCPELSLENWPVDIHECEQVPDCRNMFVDELTLKCRKSIGVLNYCYVGCPNTVPCKARRTTKACSSFCLDIA